MKTRTHKHDKRRGAVLVEMAIILPVFLTVVLGIIEFGRAMMVSQLITNAAREGARDAILPDSTNADVENTIADFLETSAGIAPGDITVTITVDPAPGNDDPLDVLANSNQRDQCTVRIEVPFNRVSYITPKHLISNNLVGYASMQHE
jgi:Flp pilus assembly protein TadG